MKTVSYIISGTGRISLVVGGKAYTVETDHKSYQKILDALKSKAYNGIEDLINVGEAIVTFSNGGASVVDGEVFYQGMPVHNSLTRRILDLMEQNMPFEPMIKFLENLMLNPSKRSVDELYGFLDVNNLPLTEDGCFLAYKRVNDDFMDFYTGKNDNSVGKTVTMTRNMVDDDKDRTCSHGLHFCSFEYLACYHGGQGKIVVVKVNPKNVVSIPTDYNNSKGRCCEYEVVAVSDRKEDVDFIDKPLYTSRGDVFTGTPYYLGCEAFNEDKMLEDCPYDVGTDDEAEWKEGFMDSADDAEQANLDDQEDYEDEDEDQDANDQVVTTYHNVRDDKGRFVRCRTATNSPKRDASGRFC